MFLFSDSREAFVVFRNPCESESPGFATGVCIFSSLKFYAYVYLCVFQLRRFSNCSPNLADPYGVRNDKGI